MIGLVVIGHGRLGAAMLESVESVIGPVKQAVAVDFLGLENANLEHDSDELEAAIKKVETGNGVVIVTDLFGGGPNNLALAARRANIEVLAGANVPMLIRLADGREGSLQAAVNGAREAGQRYISVASEVLAPEQAKPRKRAASADGRRRKEVSVRLTSIEEELANLRALLATQGRSQGAHGDIGHNLPPPPFDLTDSAVLVDAEIAARITSREIKVPSPNRDILKLALSALKRALALIKRLAAWALDKGDIFATEAAKSTGKALGPTVAASVIAVSLSGRLAEVIDFLRGIVGL